MKKKKTNRKCNDCPPEECCNCKDKINKKKKAKQSTPITLSIKATPAEAKYLRDLRRWERNGK